MTTSELAYDLRLNLGHLRDQLIRMHHLGMIEPIGIKDSGDTFKAHTYYQDVVWEVTVHTRDHRDIEPNCRACTTRALLLAGAEAILE